jgi:signal transduction histidine kinase
MTTETTVVPPMKNVDPLRSDELLMTRLAQIVEANRAELVSRCKQSLKETLFTNRFEMHPAEMGSIASEEVDAFLNFLNDPHFSGIEYGEQLSQKGMGEQAVLNMGKATRQFIINYLSPEIIAPALNAIDIYQNEIIQGFFSEREKIILAEQERIRGALQIAVGRYTVEIKDIQALAERTAESNEFKTRFIARISHELRTPLGALLGMSEMLQQNVYGPLTPAQMDITQRIINNTHVLERVFAELLDQSQLETGQMRLKQEEFAPLVLVQLVHSNNLPFALQKGLTMRIDVDHSLPGTLFGDRARIEQILSNLVINAIKYTQNGGIEISARREGDAHWLLQVKDSGIGISEENLNFIFEPFRQADETVGRQFGGVGLGLAIVKQLVMAMNGDVRVESKIGQGSTFIVILPLHMKREIT